MCLDPYVDHGSIEGNVGSSDAGRHYATSGGVENKKPVGSRVENCKKLTMANTGSKLEFIRHTGRYYGGLLVYIQHKTFSKLNFNLEWTRAIVMNNFGKYSTI